MHIDIERFATRHGSLYAAVATILIMALLMDKFTCWVTGSDKGAISYSIVSMTNLCFKQRMSEEERFSGDILADIPISDLRNEYNDCRQQRDEKLIEIAKLKK